MPSVSFELQLMAVRSPSGKICCVCASRTDYDLSAVDRDVGL